MLTTIISAVIAGLGTLLFRWLRAGQAADNKAAADASKGYILSEQEAKQAQDAAHAAVENTIGDIENGKTSSDQW